MNELHKRLKSFTYAWKGVCSFLSKEHNAWIHCAAIIAVTIAGIRFEITRNEWLVMLLRFARVTAMMAAECLHALCSLVKKLHTR